MKIEEFREKLKDLIYNEMTIGDIVALHNYYVEKNNYEDYVYPMFEFDELYTEDIAENEEWFTHNIKTISF